MGMEEQVMSRIKCTQPEIEIEEAKIKFRNADSREKFLELVFPERRELKGRWRQGDYYIYISDPRNIYIAYRRPSPRTFGRRY